MTFLPGPPCYFGENRFERLKQDGFFPEATSCVLIIDANIAQTKELESVIQRLSECINTELMIYRQHIQREPTYDDLDLLVKDIQEFTPDLIVGMGGGSCLDLAKGVSVLLRNPGPALAYRGFGKVPFPALPLLAVPTTAGSGSEATWTASFINQTDGKKLGINGVHVFARAALLEPSLLQEAPRFALVGSALDALVHAVEAISSPDHSLLTDQLASRAIDLMSRFAYEAIVQSNLEALANMQLAAYLAGVAMLNSSGGVCSGASYPLGTSLSIPHGYAGGILLPEIVAHNVKSGYARYDLVLGNHAHKECSFSELLNNLYESLDVPQTFVHWNLKNGIDVPRLVDEIFSQRSQTLSKNPVPFTKRQMVALLKTKFPQ